MNLETLRRLARWSDKIAKAQRELSDALSDELAKAEAARDPLGLHIYKARAGFRRAADRDKSKSGRRTEVALWSTFREAQKLGCKGPAKLWELLMWSGVSAEAPPLDPLGSPPQASDHKAPLPVAAPVVDRPLAHPFIQLRGFEANLSAIVGVRRWIP